MKTKWKSTRCMCCGKFFQQEKHKEKKYCGWRCRRTCSRDYVLGNTDEELDYNYGFGTYEKNNGI